MPTMSPQTRRQKDIEILCFGTGTSDLGTVLVASVAKGVVAVLIGGGRAEVIRELEERFPNARLVRDPSGQKPLVQEVVSYINAPTRNVDLKLELRGTEFQKKVWKAVRQIPFGETTTYGTLAARVGHSKAIRAVGNACTVNPYAFAVPCHRVLHGNPGLSFGHNRGNDRMRPMVLREQEAMRKRRS